MERGKIAYVYFSRFDNSSAHGFQIIHTTNALVDIGYDVNLIVSGDIEQFAANNQLEIRSNIYTCPVLLEREKIDRSIYYLYALYKSNFADIIFTRDISFLKYLSVLPWEPSVPILYEAHKSYSGMGEMSQNEERTRIKEADLVITQSIGVKKDLESLGISVHNTVPNAANEDYLPKEYPHELETKLGIKEDTTTIVYSGSLSSGKNDIKLLIETIGELQWPNLKLVIVGGNEARVQELKELVKRNGIDPGRITFVGRVPHGKVFKYLTVADIGVIPLKSNNPEATKYTSPIKLFEYLLCELRIVASSVPAVEVIENVSIYSYTPENKKKMKQAIESAASADATTSDDKYTYRKRGEQLDKIIQNHLIFEN